MAAAARTSGCKSAGLFDAVVLMVRTKEFAVEFGKENIMDACCFADWEFSSGPLKLS